jgi:hypothetical protein
VSVTGRGGVQRGNESRLGRAAHERRREGDCGWEVRRSGVSGAGGGSVRERAFQSSEECGARLRRCTARAMIPERGPRRRVRGVLVHSPSRIKTETVLAFTHLTACATSRHGRRPACKTRSARALTRHPSLRIEPKRTDPPLLSQLREA